MEISVQHFDKVEQVKYLWGLIRWMMNSQLDPGAAHTFGVVEIEADQRNSLHMHPNCEDHVLACAFERPNGGRSFGFTGCHYMTAFDQPQIRKMILNAI